MSLSTTFLFSKLLQIEHETDAVIFEVSRFPLAV